MPDVKIISDKKKILPKDVTVVEAAVLVLAKTVDDFSNADVVDTINDITVLRSAQAIVQSELDALTPQLEAIDQQIEALNLQYNALIGDRDVQLKTYQSKIKEILNTVSVEDKYGVDPSDLVGNATRFIIVNKSVLSYLPSPTYDIAALLTSVPGLKPFATLTIPKKISEELQGFINTAVTLGFLVEDVQGSSSLTDTPAAVNKFNWDESLDAH